MADEVQAGQDPPTPSPSAQAGQEPPAQSPQKDDPQALIRQLTEQRDAARKEAAGNRVAAAKLKERQDADLSEQERKDAALAAANAELTTARAEKQHATLKAHLLENATELGIRSTPGVIKYIMGALGTSDLYGDDGALDPAALEKAIKALVKDMPDVLGLATDAPPAPASPAKGTNAARPANPGVQPVAVNWSRLPGWGEILTPPK